MAHKTKRIKKQDKPLIGLLLMTLALVGLFVYIGLPKQRENFLNPTGLSQTYQETFIEKMVPKAQELQETYHVLPSIIISQAVLESNWGQSELAQKENNYFGIKDAKEGAIYSTKEYYDDWVTMDEPFKVYSSFEESMDDHAKLLAFGTSWDNLHYSEVIEATDYQSAAFALQEAGYATDPTYANKLIRIIETYELYQYD